MAEEHTDEPQEIRSKQTAITDMPYEDIVWIVTRCENTLEDATDKQEEDDLSELWTVVDTRNFFIGSSIRKQNEALKEYVMKLLIECTHLPFSWKPRRPKFITFRGLEQSDQVDMSQLGMTTVEDVHIKPWYSDAGLSCTATHVPMQSCSKCQRRGSQALFDTCQHCHGVYYCSSECERQDSHGNRASHSQDWCDRIAVYVEQASQLADLPFTYSKVTTSPDFDEKAYSDFQKALGVYGCGLWRRETPQQGQGEYQNYGDILYKEHIISCEGKNTFAVDTLEKNLQEITGDQRDSLRLKGLKTWREYYTWRGLELDSPCAILMHWSLTVYHILVNLMPLEQVYTSQAKLYFAKETIRIHIIGVQKEVDILPVFYELGHLFPEKSFEITMVGIDLTRKVNKQCVSHGNRLLFIFEKGLYHTVKFSQSPDVVIGFNAGIGAYSSWLPTIQLLSQSKTPAFFTDYCQYSCECSQPAVTSTGAADISEVYINPFRCPVRKYSEGTAFPWYSNGFIYCLRYNSTRE